MMVIRAAQMTRHVPRKSRFAVSSSVSFCSLLSMGFLLLPESENQMEVRDFCPVSALFVRMEDDGKGLCFYVDPGTALLLPGLGQDDIGGVVIEDTADVQQIVDVAIC